MTTPDRTEDLLRLMLERRAGAPPPGWLLPGVAEQVRQTRQGRHGPSLPGLPAVGGLAVSRWLRRPLSCCSRSPRASWLRQDHRPRSDPDVPGGRRRALADGRGDRHSASDAGTHEGTTGGDSGTRRPRGRQHRGRHDSRRRPASSIQAGSRRGLREAHTAAQEGQPDARRRRPGRRRHYDWYEVQAANGPVRLGGRRKGQRGLDRAHRARVPDYLDESALWTVDPIDFLVCYGDTPVDVRALHAEPMGGDTGTPEPRCRYADVPVPCKVTPQWLFEPLSVGPVANDQRGPDARARPAVRNQLNEMPAVAFMTLTMAMDNAQAGECRVVDSDSRDLIPRDEAVTRCRMRFVITDVTWDPEMVLPLDDDVARVLPAALPVYSSPGGDKFERGLVAGDQVLVVDDPDRTEGAIHWLTVIPRSGMGWPAGWVPFLIDGRPTLERVNVGCPAPDDWHAIDELDVAARMACFGSGQKLTYTVKVLSQPAGTEPRSVQHVLRADAGVCPLRREA